MGKASSTKKIQRVQKAGSKGKPGERKNVGFPVAIGVIVVVGALLVWYARDQRTSTASEAPAPGDHWHIAYGTYLCGAFTAPLNDVGQDIGGIHSHGDGVIHVHPFSAAYGGANATLDKFTEMVGIDLSDDSITMPDGMSYTNGDSCGEGEDAQPGIVQIAVFPPQSGADTEPEILTQDLLATRFNEDGMAITIAFAPEGADIPLPPTMSDLEELGAVDSDATQSTETPAPIPGDTSSSAPTEDTTATTAPTDTTATTAPTDTTDTTTGEPAPDSTNTTVPPPTSSAEGGG